MTVMSDVEIESLLLPDAFERHIVEPFIAQKTVHPASGMTFGLSSCGYDIRIAQGLYLCKGDFALASSLESFQMPEDVVGFVHDKSTLARRGIALQNTVIEPGWRGFLTLEITNHSPINVNFLEGQPIAQVIFHYLSSPTSRPYRGKYQNQPNKPVEAIIEKS